jgi:hypothetical protein
MYWHIALWKLRHCQVIDPVYYLFAKIGRKPAGSSGQVLPHHRFRWRAHKESEQEPDDIASS